VKDKSAATLYSTDAANSVIVVTTKGKAGSTRWTWFGEGGLVQDKNSYPTAYAEGPHSTGATTRFLNNTINSSCTFDSLTSLNIMKTPGLRRWRTATTNHTLRVNGGNDAVRYFVSGELQSEVGPVKIRATTSRRSRRHRFRTR
jgi:hypothetical protein